MLVFKVNHSNEGDFSVEHLGTIDFISFEDPTDIGGFERVSTNVLYVSDLNGLHAIEINKGTGLPTGLKNTYTTGTDPNNSEKTVEFNTAFKIASDRSSGSTMIITFRNNLVSFFK